MSRPSLPLAHLRPGRVPLAAAVAASVAAGLALIGQAFAVGALVVAVVEGRPLAGPALALALVTLVRMACAAVVEVATARAAGLVARDLRRRVLAAALSPAAGAAGPRTTGRLAVLLTRGVGATEPWFTRYLPAVLLAGVLPVATLVVITVLDPWSGLVVALTLPLVPLFAALVGLSTRDRAREQWRLMEALSGHFVDLLRGLPTLVAHRRAARQAGVVRAVTDRYRRASLDTLRLAFASTVVLELLATLSVALVAVCVGLRLAAGSLDFETALVVLLLAPEAYWPLRRVGAEFHAAAEGGAALEAADRVLADARIAAGAAGPAGGGPVSVTLHGVDLGYDGRPVLTGLDLDLGPGLTALVGPSGCGKSTLLGALVGELAPLRGRLLLDGVDRADADLDAWRRRVAYAPQRPWLVEGSIGENVRLGRPDADDAEVWAALEAVGLAHLVLTLDGGLDAPLGEDGAGLSAGERARVVLARVVLADRPVVVLDEPTAHLDAASEDLVLTTVRRLARDRTVVVVAHRPAVAEAADRVVDLGVRTADRATAGGGPGSAPTTVRAPETPVGDEPVPPAPWWLPVLGVASALSGVALTATAGWLITRAAAQPPVLTLMVAIVAVRTFGIARPVLAYLERLGTHDHALRLLARRRAAVYADLVPLVPGRLDLRRGDLLATVVDDVDVVVDERVRVRQPLVTGALVCLATAGLALALLPARAVAVAGLVVGLGVLTAAVVATVAVLAGRAERGLVAARGRLATRVEATLAAGRNLALWQREATALADVDEAGAALARAAARSAAVRAAGRAVLLGGVGAASVAMALLVDGRLPGPTAALLVLLPLALGEVLVPLVDAGALAGRCAGARHRLGAIAGAWPAVVDPEHPVARPATTEVPDVLVADGGITHRPVDLRLAPGARVGLMGPSGCGKSTLAGQLLRFTDPPGAVRLDGVDLRELALDDVRSTVALVDDDPYLFATTVAENLRLARPEATDDQVAAALVAARLGPWLAALPDGLHTMLGEGHQGVSGGERARIGVARALLARQPVVVLDEPTAHLDAETATRLADDVLAATAGRSLLWIGHTGVPEHALDAVVRMGDPDGVRSRPRAGRS